MHLFRSLEDAREKLERWRQDYNHCRPHSALGDWPPVAFAQVSSKGTIDYSRRKISRPQWSSFWGRCKMPAKLIYELVQSLGTCHRSLKEVKHLER
jgi:hypothetical protein